MHHTTAVIAARRGQRGRRADLAGRARPAYLQRLALGLGLLVLVALAVMGLRSLAGDAPAPKRQVARIAILPDTPPPPPPPPKEQKPEQPKPEQRPQQQPDDAVKPPPAPADAPIKMEGAAGNGPSAFAAGAVTQDYQGGAPTVGGSGASSPSVADRAQERLYAGTVRQLLRDEIERQLSPDAGELTASFALWVAGDGRISRWEFDGAAPGDASRQALLKTALDRSADLLKLPAPPALTQPMRFKLTLRAGG